MGAKHWVMRWSGRSRTLQGTARLAAGGAAPWPPAAMATWGPPLGAFEFIAASRLSVDGGDAGLLPPPLRRQAPHRQLLRCRLGSPPRLRAARLLLQLLPQRQLRHCPKLEPTPLPPLADRPARWHSWRAVAASEQQEALCRLLDRSCAVTGMGLQSHRPCRCPFSWPNVCLHWRHYSEASLASHGSNVFRRWGWHHRNQGRSCDRRQGPVGPHLCTAHRAPLPCAGAPLQWPQTHPAPAPLPAE